MEVKDDAQLMLRFQEGSEKAFEEIVRRYQKKILNLAYRYLGANYSFAEDVAQEVFVRIFKSRKSYTPSAKFSTWLFRIAINICLNEQRRMRPVQFSSSHGAGDERSQDFERAGPADGKTPSPKETLEKEELRRQVRDAVSRLPEKQRLAIILSRYEQMSYEDIADAMDCSLEAVKSLLFRAREGLRKSLSKYVRG